MALASTSAEKSDLLQSPDSSPSNFSSDAASDTSAGIIIVGDSSDRSGDLSRDPELQSPSTLRSEEYRQLFRLPAEEVLVQDFNCAFQESILLQGHMYVFLHYICFYSNIFGFETKKIIPFNEVTCLRRAKTAGIFPNAIEIVAGVKKYFFASFLSRDEAFNLINDGLLQHSNGAKDILDRQDSKSESSIQENGVMIETVDNFIPPGSELDSVERNCDGQDSGLPDPREDIIVSTTIPEVQDNVEEDAETVMVTASNEKTFTWKQENSDAPVVPEYYTKVAETNFPIKVEEFFNHFFSDDAASFVELFHGKCGDKDFRCSSWCPHPEFGHVRDVSFQHPIKLYFGAKFGGCAETQKFHVYKNSHLIIETSQEVSDVPYADYFQVKGLWDVENVTDESKEGCILRVYVNVAFSKKTMWKGKIEQSTVEECRDAYVVWISCAREVLVQKELEKQSTGVSANVTQNGPVVSEREAKIEEPSGHVFEASDAVRISKTASDANDTRVRAGGPLPNSTPVTSVGSFARETVVNLFSSMRSQSHLPLVLVITFAIILLLMQMSIVALLSRPQQVHVISQADYINSVGAGGRDKVFDTTGWVEKRIHFLKNDMLFIEAELDKMRHEYDLLKAQLKDLELLRNHKQ